MDWETTQQLLDKISASYEETDNRSEYDKGFEAGYEDAKDANYEFGYNDGYDAGYDVGWDEGYEQGLEDAVHKRSDGIDFTSLEAIGD